MSDAASTVEAVSDPGPGADSQDELWPRYEQGEELGPLLRGLVGGVVGGLAALAVDWIIGTAAGVPWLWPSVVSMAATGSAGDMALGATLVLAGLGAAALVFVFGEFRRFVPGPDVAAGAVWALVLWLVAGPLLLPHWIGLERATDAPAAVLALASLALLQSLVSVLVFGAVVGWMSPRRHVDSRLT